MGYEVMNLCKVGNFNVALGYQALKANLNSYNTGLGFIAGKKITTGSYNTFLGSDAGSDSSQKVDAVNSTAIGYDAYTTKSNQVVIGNSSVTETKLAGVLNVGTTTDYADNAAAIAGGLVVGDVYRTGDLLKIVH